MKLRLSETAIGRPRKFRLFFIGYVTAWFVAGVLLQVMGVFGD